MNEVVAVNTPGFAAASKGFTEKKTFGGDIHSSRRDRWIGFVIASLIHILFLWIGNVTLVSPVQYGVEAGMGGIEVSLVAAPVQEEVSEVLSPSQEKKEEPEPAKAISTNTPIKGDGSSTVPGSDPTTFYAQGGATTHMRPSYLRNPAPLYPAAARRMGQQGLVVLFVSVSEKGLPVDIEVQQSSGFSLLDEAALRAVRKWKFEPAHLGSLRVESRVEIPIRFQLEEEKR